MKLGTIFLVVGLFLSVISKIFQFKIKSYSHIGNIIVIPAAVCFCLAILFNIKSYQAMFYTDKTHLKAIALAIFACGAVVSFQIMMILILSKKLYGIVFSVPFLCLLFLFIKNWPSGIAK